MSNPELAAKMNVAEQLHLLHCPLRPVVPAESLSALGLFISRNEGDLFQGIALCREAISRTPEDTAHYYHLGKVYLLAGKKHLALHSFRKGLKYGEHRGLIREIQRLGFRRSPIFPFLGRKHPLNRIVGILLTHLGWR